MPIRSLLLSASLLLAAPALGQAPASQPPASQPLGGPLVPGVCLLSREAVFTNAVVGKAANTRLQELARAAQAEIDAGRTPLEAEAKALEAVADSAQTRQRREALATRWQALQAKAAHNGREIEATRAKALERIANEAQPVIAQTYAGRKCGLLLDRSMALGGNFANDITADVVKGLDARLQSIPVERERLPEAAAR
ncbi:OmpH family outer membrane protein [Sandaracinobacter sp. RS1-74]|uniref:OmpH family outer membrane protein n=1 Tax=Sandaracinobacteroides sayramensis TaxID=2913411 RepID=UPI001EDA4037|nr:OmpH family outer membrane protein [Sandaracinobacteroides sayramensis]MCG2840698.1 OmpH family outer membrane protein [Sandaracinobacteroides sayramensis]